MKYLALCFLAMSTPAFAKETIGVFGEWGTFRDTRGSTVCYVVSAPSASSGKGRAAPQLVVSIWPRQNIGAQVMVGGGAPVKSMNARVNGASFTLSVRGESGWMPDAHGDLTMLSALAGASRVTIEGRTTRGTKFSDSYALTGFSEAWGSAQKACR